MGREAQCNAHVGAETAAVKALLESSGVILRGGIRRRYALADLQALQVAGEQLRFSAGGEAVALDLGNAEAARWLKKLSTPPPTLAAKLGIGPASPALVFGPLDDAALAEALQGARTRAAAKASCLVAVVFTAGELQAAVQLHATLPCPALWVVHPKGTAASLGDSHVRQTLRGLGYVDNKSTAVSAALTATRYTRRTTTLPTE